MLEEYLKAPLQYLRFMRNLSILYNLQDKETILLALKIKEQQNV